MKRIYAVLDTNVLVSAFLKRSSNPRIVVEMATEGIITPVLSEGILDEYNDRRRKFRLNEKDIQNMLDKLQWWAVFICPAEIEEILPDEDNVVFYSVTMEARKENETYLITGNKRHFPLKTYIVNPKEFLRILEENGIAFNT